MHHSNGFDQGWIWGEHGGQRPLSRIILGKPEEWCSGVKMPYKALFLKFIIMLLLYEIKSPITLYGIASTTLLLQIVPFKLGFFKILKIWPKSTPILH